MAVQPEGPALELPATPPSSPARPGLVERLRLWSGRLGLLGPLAVVSVQVLVNYLHVQLPAHFVARHQSDPRAYHLYLAKHFAYSDLYTLYWHHHLYRHPVPYVDIRIEYPVVIGLFMAGAAALTKGVRAYFLLSSIGLWACALGSVALVWNRSKKAAWILACCPLFLVYSLLNWDLLGIFFMLAGWVAFLKKRYVLSALFLTIGTFTKAYPAFLLLFCLVALVRQWRSGELRATKLGAFVGSGLVTAAVLNLPFILINEKRWAYFFVLNQERNQRDSILYWFHILDQNSSRALSNDVFAALSCLAIAAGGYAVWRRVSPAKATAVVFAVFLMVQKVYSPQYLLWLFVFAVLAEWEGWALAAVAFVGLADYASASLNIYLQLHSHGIDTWYDRQVKPYNRDGRLLVLLVVSLFACLRPISRRKHRRAVRALPS